MAQHRWTAEHKQALVLWRNAGWSWTRIVTLIAERYGITVTEMAVRTMYFRATGNAA